jgi:uncharacterized tellurite resistance protein B-like protein
MLEYLKKILLGYDDNTPAAGSERKIQAAACALFIEMAKADGNFTGEEKEEIISVMKSLFNIDDEYAAELMDFAEADIKESISYYEFTNILDEAMSRDEKYEVIKSMWRIIYKDNKLDKFEDQLVKRIGGMLNLDFRDIIAAKLEVKKEKSL